MDAPNILKGELEISRQALRQVIDEATKHHQAGLSADDAVAASSFGDLETWTLRASQGERAIRKVYQELNGDLP